MQSTNKEALSRMFAQAADIDLDSAKKTMELYLPDYLQSIGQPDTDKLTADEASQLFNNLANETNLSLNKDYMDTTINNEAIYAMSFDSVANSISKEKQAQRDRLGDALGSLLSVYVGQSKLQSITSKYRSQLVHDNPADDRTARADDPNYKEAQEKYNNYVAGVKQAQKLLNYLNNRRINASIDVDKFEHGSTDLVATLPEYNNMKVTLMSDNPRDIGNVNTWNAKVGFDRKAYDDYVNNVQHNPNFLLHPAFILDTVLRPNVDVTEMDPFENKDRNQNYTNMSVKTQATAKNPNGIDVPVPLFATGLTDHKILDPYSIKSTISDEEVNDRINSGDSDSSFNDDPFDDDPADENGLDDPESLKITTRDKHQELHNRTVNDWKSVDLKQDKANGGIGVYITGIAQKMGLKNIKLEKNSAGVYRYNYETINNRGLKKKGYGVIGGYIPPEKDGSFKLTVNGKLRGYSVPGMRGYIDPKTGDLRVKPFGQTMYEEIHKSMMDQVMNPKARNAGFGALDNLYTTDTYSTIINKGVNSPEYEKVLIDTLKGRVRLSNDLLENANAYNEDADTRKANKSRLSKLMSKTPYLKGSNNKRAQMLAEEDLRTIPKQWQKYVDREMTGIGKTMGASLFLGDDVKINRETGELTRESNEPAKSALHKLDLFDFNKFDPADRNIMAFNQAIRNVPIDKVNVAMMTMSGYTENDAAVITAKYAQNHMIKDAKTGELRPLKRGDKISDLHGNKSTISEVIDPNEKDPARREKLKREIAIVAANPDLDIVVNPYSSISRLNTGSAREMQAGPMKQMNSPKEFPNIDLSGVTMGQENYVVAVGQKVDEKTKVYSEDDFKKGDGRRFSHQLAAAAASADMPKLLDHVYSNSTSKGWGKFFDDIHMLGYDIDKDHNVGHFDYDRDDAITIDIPDKETAKENAKLPEYKRKEMEREEFKTKFQKALDKAGQSGKPIMLQLPGEYENAAGMKTNKIVVPIEQIRARQELGMKMGLTSDEMQNTSPELNALKRMYNYAAGYTLDKKRIKGSRKSENIFNPNKAIDEAKNLINDTQSRDFGTHKNVVKNDIFSTPMKDSATAVITPDPNLDMDTVAVGPEVYDNLHLNNPDEKVLFWRDPILRDGGFRAMHVVKDETLTGAALNPVAVKSLDADFDGDTVGIVPVHDPDVQKEMEKQKVSKHLTNPAAKDPESYLETGLELQGSLFKQGVNDAQKRFNDPNITADEARKLIKQGFDNDAAYGTGIDMRSKDSYLDSISKLVESGAKGHYEKDDNGQPIKDANGRVVSRAMKDVEHYYDGERTDQDMHESMIGLAVKADGVGPAGRVQQNLLWSLRNINPKDAMDFSYLATQSTLQAKHDGQEAQKRMSAVLGPIPRLMQGQDPHDSKARFRQNQTMSPQRFVNEANDEYNEILGLNLSEDVAKGIADSLATEDGKHIRTTKQRLELADPLDIIAYESSNGVRTISEKLDYAMDNNRKFGDGYYTKYFKVPEELCSDKVLGHAYENEAENTEEVQQSAPEQEQVQEETPEVQDDNLDYPF